MKDFISVDWGTTSLRVSLCADAGNSVIQTIAFEEGILAMNQRFLAKGDPSSQARKLFFEETLDRVIHDLDLSDKESHPVLISGMASSNIGMEMLPYARLPFALDGQHAVVKQWQTEDRSYFMVSGLATEDDLMRGEETQLVGAAALTNLTHREEALFIFPGTHAKHVKVANGAVQEFKTYMTGEVFCQLFSNSILAQSVMVHHDHNESNTSAFVNGVQEGAAGNILQKIFKVRTNGMFNRMNKEENFSYLSGMLIGAELKDLVSSAKRRIILCGKGEMMQAYQLALKSLGILCDEYFLTAVDANAATAVGQYRIIQRFSSRF